MQPPPDNVDFSIRTRVASDGQEAIVIVSGDVDLTTADELVQVVRQALARGPVLLDLREVSFMDSSGLRALDALVRDSRAGGGDLRIDPALSDSVAQILELTGLMTILPLADS